MSQRKRILVLTDDMPWGHRSIAKAIFAFLKQKEKEAAIKVDYTEVKASLGSGAEAYKFVYRYLPLSNRIAYKIGSGKMARKLFHEFSIFNSPRLIKTVKYFKPDLIICSYFYHSHTLSLMREEGIWNGKLWTVVADPWTVNPATLVPKADLQLVYDEVGLRSVEENGGDKKKVMVTGWWTRPEMYKKYDREISRKKLGFGNDDRPLIFVGGGSLGTNSLTKLLPVLMMVKKPVGVVFNTGTDKLAFSMVEEYVKMLKTFRNDSIVKVKNMGWIENMAEVLAGCDMVFGKAGPNFMFDVVAAQKPMVAITHIGGQEDGNIELIEKKGLGWVKEKGGEAAAFFLKYVANPEKYNHKFDKNIKAEAERNSKSMEKIWLRMKKDLEV